MLSFNTVARLWHGFCFYLFFKICPQTSRFNLILITLFMLKQGPKVIKINKFMLNLAEHEIYPAHNLLKCRGILTFISMINTTSERPKASNFFICRYFSFYEQLKFHAQLS